MRLGVSGTAIPIAETRLYKGGYGFVVLQCYVPVTQNRSPVRQRHARRANLVRVAVIGRLQQRVDAVLQLLDLKIPQGKPAFIKVGNVVTLPPESDAKVVNVGTENDPVFDFYLPEGVGFRISKTYESIEAMSLPVRKGYSVNSIAVFVCSTWRNRQNADTRIAFYALRARKVGKVFVADGLFNIQL